MTGSAFPFGIAAPSGGSRGLVLAGLGDALLAPDLASAPDSLGFRSDRAASWLRMLMPDGVAPGLALLGEAGAGTLQMLEQLRAFLPLAGGAGCLLLSAGLEDCRATLRGVAPPVDASIAAIEAAAGLTRAAGLTPVFILPPPSPLFANGLFAERYVTLAATLRRLARRDPGILLVDPAARMMRPRAFGIEPVPGLVGEDGGLPAAGAFRLAAAVADDLRALTAAPVDAPSAGGEPLNRNPRLGRDHAEPGVGGEWADDYVIDRQGAGGVHVIGNSLDGGGHKLLLAGRLDAGRGFIRIAQAVEPERFAHLTAGERIEAVADIALAGTIRPVAAVCVHATPVWEGGFMGLHSHDRPGDAAFDRPFRARLRTPAFPLPARLTRLHVSLTVHLQAGGDTPLDAAIDICSLSVSSAGRAPEAVRGRVDPLLHAA